MGQIDDATGGHLLLDLKCECFNRLKSSLNLELVDLAEFDSNTTDFICLSLLLSIPQLLGDR